MAEDTAELLERWKAGDQTAAAELFERYAARLVALTRSRLSPQLVQRFDPEDVVQSAYRSFFVAARAGRYDLQHGTDLWQLLVTITLHKLHHQVRHNSAGKRDVERERSLDEQSPSLAPLAREPSPIEAIALTDQVEQLMRSLQPLERHTLQLRLQGYQLDEIAEQTQRGERTVRRILERIKSILDPMQTLDAPVEPLIPALEKSARPGEPAV
jgi:RNA polymerase sigma factor (sigma-70 family)